mmetsp:Transcript_20424/g.37066  ORF Transcript_20424/g.37066 Transcript_20424/m.37066 type:complete len:500 (-) Transcript_20424:218-1717(-)
MKLLLHLHHLLLASSAFGFSSNGGGGEKIIVCGGGIGGLSTSFDLRHHLPKDTQISVISDRPDFQFTPSNPWVSIGTRTAKEISVPMVEACRAGNVNYIPGKLLKVDAAKKEAHVMLEGEKKDTVLPFDYLVGATGPKLDWKGIVNPDEHFNEDMKMAEVSVCTTPHAESGLDAFKHLVKTGGGPIVIGAMQGASCFGPAYEYAMILDHELRSKGLRDKCPITFVTSEPYVGHMGLAGVADSYKLLVQMLADRDITVLTNCEINKVDRKAGVVQISQHVLPVGEAEAHAIAGEDMFPWKASTGKQKADLPASFVMLIPQFKGQDCWKRSSKGLANEHGLIQIDEYMRNPTYPHIFGVGVAVAFPPVEETPIPTGAPKTGYLIESMGTAVAVNIREMINAKRRNRDPNPINFRRPSLDTLCLTDFGGTEGALFLASPELPPRQTAETVRGGVVKLAKVAFEKYFLFKIRTGDADPFYEKFMLKLVGIERLEHKGRGLLRL